MNGTQLSALCHALHRDRCFETCSGAHCQDHLEPQTQNTVKIKRRYSFNYTSRFLFATGRFSLLQALLLFVKFVGSFDSKFPSVHKIRASSPAALTSGCDGRKFFQAFWPHFFEQEKPYNQLIPWFFYIQTVGFSADFWTINSRSILSRWAQNTSYFSRGPCPSADFGVKKKYANANLFIFGHS